MNQNLSWIQLRFRINLIGLICGKYASCGIRPEWSWGLFILRVFGNEIFGPKIDTKNLHIRTLNFVYTNVPLL